jgi:hypothetical protein
MPKFETVIYRPRNGPSAYSTLTLDNNFGRPEVFCARIDMAISIIFKRAFEMSKIGQYSLLLVFLNSEQVIEANSVLKYSGTWLIGTCVIEKPG